jgi:hypothetical protein
VNRISAYLFHAGGDADPFRFFELSNRFSLGSKIYGQGFLFDDSDEKANPVSEMQRIIELSARSKDRIIPYLGGEEVNDDPLQKAYRWVIFLSDLLTESELSAWPELTKIVRDKVKPERDVLGDNPNNVPLKKRWWAYQAHRPELYALLSGMSRTLVIPQVTKYLVFVFQPADIVFSQRLNVLLFETWASFGVLQSRPHELWALFFGSTLEDRPVYTPSDCFQTFPFPAGFEVNVTLEAAGREYYEFRAALMVRYKEGLTKTYNRFHDPEESNSDFLKLRELHAQMDAAVLSAYGWTDLLPQCRCEFLLDYEDEASEAGAEESGGRKKKKPWRYRWPDEIRDEVLARLLKLNAERAEEERRTGLGASSQIPKSKGASRPRRLAGKENGGQVAAVPRTRQQELF